MTSPPKKDLWDKLPAVAAVIASIFVPLTVAYFANAHSSATKASENRVKYVELAVSILRADPSAESAPLRSWAADVLNNESPVPLSPEAREALKESKLKYWDGGDWTTQNPAKYRYNSQSYKNPNIDYAGYGCGGEDVASTPQSSSRQRAAK
jgi:hypothetical protein